MSQGHLFETQPEPLPESVRALYDVDRTPSPIAMMCLEAATRGWLRPGPDGARPRVLDVCAGSGPWAMAARRLWPQAHITALEFRPEERAHLERWADEVVIGDVAEVTIQSLQARVFGAASELEANILRGLLRMLGAPEDGDTTEPPVLGTFDLIIGNPPFSMVDQREPPKRDKDGNIIGPGKSRLRAFEVLVVALRHFLAPRGREVLYVPAAWWRRGEDIAHLARQHNPFRELNVPLSISHRGPGFTAAPDNYTTFVWSPPDEHHGVGWHAMDLDVLPAKDRKWVVQPGTEAEYEVIDDGK